MSEEDKARTDTFPQHGILAELESGVRARLQAAGRFVDAKPGDYLAVQGQHHHSLAVILDGKVAVTAHAHGDTIQLATLERGQTVGEMSVIDPRPASANARVIESPARLWTIRGEEFERFVENDHEAGKAIFRLLARELCQRLRHDSETMLRRADELRNSAFDMDY